MARHGENSKVLFVLSGSSASGKTTLARAVSGRVLGLHVHELGEIADQPWDGDVFNRWWRRNLTERWLQRAIELEKADEDLLLTEGVLGEVLAAPSADRVSGIAACLVDCDDRERPGGFLCLGVGGTDAFVSRGRERRCRAMSGVRHQTWPHRSLGLREGRVERLDHLR
jgi:hypothetical protein